eukprot:scaffold57045_cov52-Attheya_sp.AAC.8
MSLFLSIRRLLGHCHGRLCSRRGFRSSATAPPEPMMPRRIRPQIATLREIQKWGTKEPCAGSGMTPTHSSVPGYVPAGNTPDDTLL